MHCEERVLASSEFVVASAGQHERGTAWNASDDEADPEMIAKLRVAAFLHNMMVVSPCAFICRYIQAEFLKLFFMHRGKYLALKMATYFALVVCILPYVYMNTILAYPCDPVEALLSRDGLSQDVVIEEKNCEVQDFLRSPWAFTFGPICMPCIALIRFVSQKRDRGKFEWSIVTMRKVMALKKIPFCSNGHVWFYGGTGGLRTSDLARRTDMKDETHSLHDAFGAPDVAALVTMMNVCLSGVVSCAPVARSVVVGDPWYESAKAFGIGSAVSLVTFRFLFLFADMWLGAPAGLVEAAEGMLYSWVPSEEGDCDRNQIEDWLKRMHKQDPDNRGSLLNVLQRLQTLKDPHFEYGETRRDSAGFLLQI